MPKFALYDPADAAPQPVRGWYDTDNFTHAQLPEGDRLIQVTDAVWKARLADPSGFVVKKGKIVPKEKS